MTTKPEHHRVEPQVVDVGPGPGEDRRQLHGQGRELSPEHLDGQAEGARGLARERSRQQPAHGQEGTIPHGVGEQEHHGGERERRGPLDDRGVGPSAEPEHRQLPDQTDERAEQQHPRELGSSPSSAQHEHHDRERDEQVGYVVAMGEGIVSHKRVLLYATKHRICLREPW